LIHAFSKIQPPHSNIDNIPHNDRIKLAITNLKSQDHPNYTTTTIKYHLVRTTLSRRHQDVTDTKEEAYSYSIQTLINMQESVLVQYINNLSARELPPTPQIIKNLAEKITDKKLDHN